MSHIWGVGCGVSACLLFSLISTTVCWPEALSVFIRCQKGPLRTYPTLDLG